MLEYYSEPPVPNTVVIPDKATELCNSCLQDVNGDHSALPLSFLMKQLRCFAGCKLTCGVFELLPIPHCGD